MSNVLVQVLGWRATMIHGDPCVVDRWMFVRRYLRSGAVRTLDAGAGNGGFALMAGSQGNDVVALSFVEDELVRAQQRASSVGMSHVAFRIGDLRRLDEFSHELGTFDQILCLEVIEHLDADQELINGLARLLRPGGQLIVSAPSVHHRPLFTEALSLTEDGGHVRWGYSPEKMAAMLESADLRVVVQGCVSGYASQKLTNLMRRCQRISRGFGWAVVLPLRVVQLVDRPITRALRWPFLSITAVAVKADQ